MAFGHTALQDWLACVNIDKPGYPSRVPLRTDLIKSGEVLQMMVVRRTYLTVLGLTFAIAGLLLAAWALMRPRNPSWDSLAITDGAVRPEFAILSLPGGRLAVTQDVITQGQFVRAMRTVPLTALSPTGESATCPVAFDSDAPVTCLTDREIAGYANALTRYESRERQARLTDCYTIDTEIVLVAHCTGYRVPTMVEWRALRAFSDGIGQEADTVPLPVSTLAELVQKPYVGTLQPAMMLGGKWTAMNGRTADMRLRLVRGAR